jgi:hypothetical protein
MPRPTVAGADLDGDELTLGATGHVHTPFGVALPFSITEFDGTVVGARLPSGARDRTGANRSNGALASEKCRTPLARWGYVFDGTVFRSLAASWGAP